MITQVIALRLHVAKRARDEDGPWAPESGFRHVGALVLVYFDRFPRSLDEIGRRSDTGSRSHIPRSRELARGR